MKSFKDLKLKRRAIATLAGMHFFGNPSKKLKIVGVTGTNGKTTTATTLYKVGTALGYKCGLIGTVENIIVNESRPAKNTTPGPLDLNKLLNEMMEKGCEYVFMEVSSHSIDQKRIAGVSFVGGVFSNLTHDHLDYHKNMESYFQTKKKFFDNLSKDAFALTNIDDSYGLKMIADTKAKKYTYGFNNKSDFGEKIKSSLIGGFNEYNILAVFAVTKILNFDEQKVREVLLHVTPPAGRFESFVSEKGVTGVVDFAHTPDALEKIIKTAKDIVKDNGKVISVFGCGGDKDPFKRPVMGKLSADLADISIFTADNPRSENVEKIIETMCVELTPEELQKVKKFQDRNEAIVEAGKIAQKGDIILLMGKGPETYQDIKGVKHPWNDIEKLKQALK